jgi:hypothetical protein
MEINDNSDNNQDNSTTGETEESDSILYKVQPNNDKINESNEIKKDKINIDKLEIKEINIQNKENINNPHFNKSTELRLPSEFKDLSYDNPKNK